MNNVVHIAPKISRTRNEWAKAITTTKSPAEISAMQPLELEIFFHNAGGRFPNEILNESIAAKAEAAKAEPEPVRFKKPYAGILSMLRNAGMPHNGARRAASSLYSRYGVVGVVQMSAPCEWECIVQIVDYSIGHGERFIVRFDHAGSMVYSSLID
jgi:hypothetical protein